MRVGILTSWRVPCGIYQYSARLAEAMARHHLLEPIILAGRADEHRSVPEEWEGRVYDGAAGIGLWRDDGRYWLAQSGILGLGLDALHVQYQSMLFSQEQLAELTRQFPGPTAITYHDNCQRPDFPYDAFDLHFSHRWNVGPPSVEVIPFGVEDRPPVLRSFGLGRTQSELIAPMAERHGWVYESGASHESIHGGGQAWLAHEELIRWLRGADAIVLWYPEVDQAGSSQAVRTAMAARRPVYTNDVKWFEDLPARARAVDEATYYTKCENLESLEVKLMEKFDRPYVRGNSWDEVAKHLCIRYAGLLSR